MGKECDLKDDIFVSLFYYYYYLYLMNPALDLMLYHSRVYVLCFLFFFYPKIVASDKKKTELERVLTSFVLAYKFLNTFFWSLYEAYPMIGSRSGVKIVSIRISKNRRLRNFPRGFKALGKPRFHLISSLLYSNGCATNCK